MSDLRVENALLQRDVADRDMTIERLRDRMSAALPGEPALP